eukprot:scaffold16664_cov21-Tisochrysis_lutea.AAC.4
MACVGVLVRDGVEDAELRASVYKCAWLQRGGLVLQSQLFRAELPDCDAKMAYFLDVFSSALTNPESHWQDWQDEYKQIKTTEARNAVKQLSSGAIIGLRVRMLRGRMCLTHVSHAPLVEALCSRKGRGSKWQKHMDGHVDVWVVLVGFSRKEILPDLEMISESAIS